MQYYDIVLNSSNFTLEFEHKLGFKHIYKIDDAAIKNNVLGSSKNINELINFVRRGSRAVIIDDFTIDRKLIAEMKDRGCMLLLPISAIISKNGFALTRIIYKARMLALYANNKNVDISLCSYSSSINFMNSVAQLKTLGAVIGIPDDLIKKSICENNKTLGEVIGKN